MKTKLTVQQRQNIIEQSKEKDFTLTIGKTAYPAQLAGAKLDAPFVWCRLQDGGTQDVEISWSLAERLANGVANNVTI